MAKNSDVYSGNEFSADLRCALIKSRGLRTMLLLAKGLKSESSRSCHARIIA